MKLRTFVKSTMAASAALLVSTAAAPALAGFELATVNVVTSDSDGGSGTAPAPTVAATCSIDSVLYQGNGMQIVVSGSAQATGGVALGTHVRCDVYTAYGPFGGPSGDMVGPTAVAAGTSDVIPLEKLAGLRVCAYGSAFFAGGIVKHTTASPNC